MNGLRIPRCGPGRAWLGRAVLAAGVAAAVACTSTAARADEESGVAVGLRIGGGIPFGNAYAGEGFSNFERASFPIWFDAGYRMACDVEWLTRVKDIGIGVEMLARSLVSWRVHGANGSYDRETMRAEQFRMFRSTARRQREVER